MFSNIYSIFLVLLHFKMEYGISPDEGTGFSKNDGVEMTQYQMIDSIRQVYLGPKPQNIRLMLNSLPL